MLTLAQWIARLTKGYAKATGKKPDKLAQLKIKFEASQKVKNQEKVIPFPQERITDWRVPRPTEGPHKADVISSGIGKKAETAKTIDEDKFVADFMAQADRAYYRFVNETLVKVQNASKDEQLQIAKDIINRKGMYHNLDEQDAAKILKSVDQNIRPVEPKAGGGLAGMLGEPTYADDNHRVPFKDGKRSKMSRRSFLKAAAGLATIPIIGKFFKWAKPLAKTAKVTDLTSVPIGNPAGMPAWFKPLVNKVIREGDDVTKKFATADREIVHATKIGDDDMVTVTQSLDDGTIRLQYNSPDTIGESGVELVYKKGEVIPTKKGSVKTKDEFTAVEDDFYPQATSPDGDFDLEFTENIVKNVDDLYSDTSKLKQFATGKKLTIKEISEATKKKNYLKEVDKNPNDHAFRNAPDYDPPYEDDFASGGRVPLVGGGLLGKFTKAEVLLQMFENTIKQSKSANTKKRFTNFIKEIKAKPELANDPEVWGFFTKGLPKNQRLVVHSDDTVDFWTQSDFGPHNIETTNKFMKKHPYFTREQAIKIQNMEPEDQILEMKRLETIRNRTKNATGGLAGMLGE